MLYAQLHHGHVAKFSKEHEYKKKKKSWKRNTGETDKIVNAHDVMTIKSNKTKQLLLITTTRFTSDPTPKKTKGKANKDRYILIDVKKRTKICITQNMRIHNTSCMNITERKKHTLFRRTWLCSARLRAWKDSKKIREVYQRSV